MDTNWIKGNQPEKKGLYWITLLKTDSRHVELAVFDNAWHATDIPYKEIEEANVIAFVPVVKPAEYNPDRIGDPDRYYIKVQDMYGNTLYYARNQLSVNVSKRGFGDIAKAANAAKRARKRDIELYPMEKRNYYVVDGNSNVVKIIAEDILQKEKK